MELKQSKYWLKCHCFEYNRKNKEYKRHLKFDPISLFAKFLNEINKWIVSVRVNVDGKEYKFSMMMEDITDNNFRLFVWCYNREIRKQPFGYISNYHLDFTNNMIT